MIDTTIDNEEPPTLHMDKLSRGLNRLRQLLPKTRSGRKKNKTEARRELGVVSNHVMVNELRKTCGVPPLERCGELDEYARRHVEYTAKRKSLVHSVEDAEDLQAILKSEQVGENIQRGESVREMHQATVQSGSMQFQNLISREFRQFGMATARGPDDKLYMCQVFRG